MVAGTTGKASLDMAGLVQRLATRPTTTWNTDTRLSKQTTAPGHKTDTPETTLIGLQDRAEAIGGTISLLSPEGKGTSLHVELPLDVPT